MAPRQSMANKAPRHCRSRQGAEAGQGKPNLQLRSGQGKVPRQAGHSKAHRDDICKARRPGRAGYGKAPGRAG
jgi:hypothetical protein